MTHLKIATWNLEQPPKLGYKKADRQEHELLLRNADIAVLTETRDIDSSFLNCGWVKATSSKSQQLKNYHRWVSVNSRFHLSKVLHDFETKWTCSLRIQLPSMQNVVVLGTVLPWLGGRGRIGWNQERVVEEIHKQVAIWQKLKLDFPSDILCIAGDFNQVLTAGMSNEVDEYEALTSNSLIYGNLKALKLQCLTSGENDPVACQTSGKKSTIDHVCISGEIRNIKTSCWPNTQEPDKTLSDHFGIIAEFDLMGS
jgi:hypothetical protein